MHTSTPSEISTIRRQLLSAASFCGHCACGKKKPVIYCTPSPGSEVYYTAKCGDCDPTIVAPLEKLRTLEAARDAEDRRINTIEPRIAEQIGSAFARCTFASFTPETPSQQKALDMLKHGWWNRKPFALLCGRPGVGKTHLAAASYRLAACNGGKWDHHPNFSTESAFINGWRAAAATRKHFDETERLTQCGTLILDDIGTTRHTDGSLELMFQVIDARYRRGDDTLFTTNYSLQELEQRIGEKLLSRIIDQSSSTVLMVEGPNHRLKVMN